MPHITRETALRINPSLVVWPGESLVFGFAGGAGHVEAPLHLPTPALRVLRAFSVARRVCEVFPAASGDIISTLELAVDRGLLLTTQHEERDEPISKRFEGFHVMDHKIRIDRETITPHISRYVRLSGKSIFVLDGVFAPSQQHSAYRWLLQLPYQLHDVDSLQTMSYRHWISVFSPIADYYEAVPIINQLVKIARALFRSKHLSITRSHSYCVPYGDVQFAHQDFDTGKGVTGLYFANTEWREEWGSEMLFFGKSGEAEIAIAPKPGRIIVFRGDLKHRAGAPFRTCPNARYTLVVRLIADSKRPDIDHLEGSKQESGGRDG
jgi:SM-20-related protein